MSVREDAATAQAGAPAATSVGEYLGLAWRRIKGGETGVLPVVGGLILVSVLFQALDGHFLTAGNLVNLLVQAAVFALLSMAEVFVLLLGEIDLSVGFVAGIGAVVLAWLARPQFGWPWWAAIGAALVATTLIGLLHGTLITRIGLPSFVVTLGGLLFWQGVMLFVLGNGGSIQIQDPVLNAITSGTLSRPLGWALMLVVVAVFGVVVWRRDARRRGSGLVAPPGALTLAKIAALLVGGAGLILLANADRGMLAPVYGLPWVVVLVLGVLVVWAYLLGRRRFGLYVYAVGGNAEAARRAGINLARIRTAGFVLSSLTAGIAGIVYASRLRSISTSLDGGTLVLYAVAGAVIGGTSLFGGRGKALHGVLGGLVIAAIDNGMGLLGFSAAAKYVVTAVVLLVAVTIDAVARRRT
ncbi:ABC transporter permease [Isoptericola sp. b441]|uniref:Xylose transport system permease protein XylH n=1 Tax=Actinotalea lenta TaxID=3064654 RepID=A0ABT9D527_9CELL|nr:MULTISPECIES: ABC transporter permease [unclassified Isoptericola]MDO8105826.1 ABC transporter permease [Isoptericola sp. b441]MDO8122531.1 ABC transporter permease [Isoptericola sp. b490]